MLAEGLEDLARGKRTVLAQAAYRVLARVLIKIDVNLTPDPKKT